MVETALQIRGLTKRYGPAHKGPAALTNINLTVEAGEFIVLLGPSGSGKTTLLRCIAGLEQADEGEIALFGRTAFSGERSIYVPPEKRDIGMVFQSYAIWPHVTVLQNVALPLIKGRRRMSPPSAREKALAALDLMGISHLADRSATLVSGGQQQRIALARAIAVEPSLLLMDEPLSNLDPRLRDKIRDEIGALAERLNITVIYVTHSRVEAMALADRIVIIGDGLVHQEGTPEQIYKHPTTLHVADFLGDMNWIQGKVDIAAKNQIRTQIGLLTGIGHSHAPGSDVVVGIRPEDIVILEGGRGGVGSVQAKLIHTAYLGEYYLYSFDCAGKTIVAKTLAKLPPSASLQIAMPGDAVMVFRS
jgi:iron(III) transport system ATP-binding protein